MWNPGTASAIELNLTAVPIDYLADIVNRLSQEDFQQFQSRMCRSRVESHPVSTVDNSEHLESGIDQLTRRENEVLVLVASGYSRKEIGAALRISENTAASI